MYKKKGRKFVTLIIVLLVGLQLSFAQDVTTVEANSEEISENLDLEAVASVFGDSKDLEDFEKRLNDPETQISNLDLNEDSNVDYLRVVEIVESQTHLIAIQAVMGKNTYQDVATIEVEKDVSGKTQVQVVGDVYMYGPNYIIEPVYVYRPLIFSIFWRPYYRPFRSIYYWGYYPRHFHFWRPFHVHRYRKNVHVHVNVRHRYAHTHIRRSARAVNIHAKTRRNDFGKRYPEKSYAARVSGVNKANGTKKRAAGVRQAHGDRYRVAGVNKADGTKKRSAGVQKADGTKKRIAGVNQADGTKKRAVGVRKPDGSRKVVTNRSKNNRSKNKAKARKGYNKGKRGANKAKGKAKKGRKKRKR